MRALAGGKRHGDDGFYIEPTVLVDVESNFSVYQEKIFGPEAVDLRSVQGASHRGRGQDGHRVDQLPQRIRYRIADRWIQAVRWGRELGESAIECIPTSSRSISPCDCT